MILNRHDLRALAGSLAIALAMIVLGTAALLLTRNQRDDARHARDAARATLSDASSRLQRVRDEEREIRRKSTLFTRLQQRGVIGPEERLDWIEVLHTLRLRHQPEGMEYEFAPRQPLDSAGDHTFYRSAMTLRLQLVHEGELFALLADLRREARALVAVRSCQVQRLPSPALPPAGMGGAAPRLDATCILDWITIEGPRA